MVFLTYLCQESNEVKFGGRLFRWVASLFDVEVDVEEGSDGGGLMCSFCIVLRCDTVGVPLG